MIYKSFKRLSKLRISQLRELEKKSMAVDQVSYAVFTDAEFNFTSVEPAFFFAFEGSRMVGAVTLFLPGDESAEISALVDPEFRKKGVFKALLKQAKATIKRLKCRRILLVSTPGIPATEAVLKRLKFKLDSSEYKMLLRENTFTATVANSGSRPGTAPAPALVPVTKKDVHELARMDAEFFDTDIEFSTAWVENLLTDDNVHMYMLRVGNTNVGSGFYSLAENSCSIFGIGILPEYRGQGYGRNLMTLLLASAPKGLPVSLQVSSRNAIAFSLYQSLGFEITAQQDFYSKDAKGTG